MKVYIPKAVVEEISNQIDKGCYKNEPIYKTIAESDTTKRGGVMLICTDDEVTELIDEAENFIELGDEYRQIDEGAARLYDAAKTLYKNLQKAYKDNQKVYF